MCLNRTGNGENILNTVRKRPEFSITSNTFNTKNGDKEKARQSRFTNLKADQLDDRLTEYHQLQYRLARGLEPVGGKAMESFAQKRHGVTGHRAIGICDGA